MYTDSLCSSILTRENHTGKLIFVSMHDSIKMEFFEIKLDTIWISHVVFLFTNQ